jgi:hypothetical protein
MYVSSNNQYIARPVEHLDLVGEDKFLSAYSMNWVTVGLLIHPRRWELGSLGLADIFDESTLRQFVDTTSRIGLLKSIAHLPG